MQRYDQKGMIIFPTPEKIKKTAKMADVVVISRCFCPNGHNLVSSRAVFDGFNGIMLKVKHAGQTGFVALNPVYGLKHRISLDISLVHDAVIEIHCPELRPDFHYFAGKGYG